MPHITPVHCAIAVARERALDLHCGLVMRLPKMYSKRPVGVSLEFALLAFTSLLFHVSRDMLTNLIVVVRYPQTQMALKVPNSARYRFCFLVVIQDALPACSVFISERRTNKRFPFF